MVFLKRFFCNVESVVVSKFNAHVIRMESKCYCLQSPHLGANDLVRKVGKFTGAQVVS